MSTHDGQPRKRGGRVVARATPGQVTALARNLPLTHSVLGKAIENATPGQLGFLANLFEAECVSASWRPQYGHYFSAAQAAGFQQEPHRRNPPPLFPWLSGHEGVLAAV